MYTKGFSLLEIIIVIALVGVVASFGIGVSTDTLFSSRATEERDLFVSLLMKHLRGAALSNSNATSHGVVIDKNNRAYILFEGTTYNPEDVSNRHIPFVSKAVEVGSTSDKPIIYEQRSGAVISGTGTISFTNENKSFAVTIRESGQIDW